MGGLFISASGILNALRRNDISANNIANLGTSGFAAVRPISVETRGGGVAVVGTSRNFSPGAFMPTGASLDVAATDGFFRVMLEDGTFAFTRAGHFGVNAEGRLVTTTGALLDPAVQVPPGATNVKVAANGAVFATLPGGGTEEVGRIEVVQFTNPQGLEAMGSGLFRETTASGPPGQATGFPTVIPGFVQGSNVDVATEQVNQLLNRQAFMSNINALRAQDEMLGDLLNLFE